MHKMQESGHNLHQNFDENSELDDDKNSPSRDQDNAQEDRANQICAPTPLSGASQKDNSQLSSPLNVGADKSGRLGINQKSIKEIVNQTLIGELDVETNYLKSSNQNFADELHHKTVF